MWTDSSIKAIKPRKQSFRTSEDTNKRGVGRLLLEIKPNGAKYFFFQYFNKSNGKNRRILLTIGRFKETARDSGVSLSEARDKVREYQDILKQGVDVKQHLEAEEFKRNEELRKLQAAKRQGSLEQLIESYLAAMEADGKRSHRSVKRSFQTYVFDPFPDLRLRKANTIEADDIRRILSRMINKGITTHSNRVRSYLHAAFSHGLKQDNNPRRYTSDGVKFNLKYNPVTFVPKQPDFERVGEHVISEKEIREIWKKLPEKSVTASWAVKLAFATGQRMGEILRIRWADIDKKDRLMTIPSSVSKNKLDHVVPLNDTAWAVVQEMRRVTGKCDYLFPAAHKGVFRKDKPIFNTTISKSVREYCENNDKVGKFTSKDIRRTVKTLMGKAGIDKAIRDKVQNHALQDISSKHYDRYDYLKEKKKALKIWNSYLKTIINPD